MTSGEFAKSGTVQAGGKMAGQAGVMQRRFHSDGEETKESSSQEQRNGQDFRLGKGQGRQDRSQQSRARGIGED